jgi:hypothetical protein
VAKERDIADSIQARRQPRGADGDVSQRNDLGRVTGAPSTFIVSTKEKVKERAKALSLKTYGIVDKTGTTMRLET